jgi:hypothetical protein
VPECRNGLRAECGARRREGVHFSLRLLALAAVVAAALSASVGIARAGDAGKGTVVCGDCGGGSYPSSAHLVANQTPQSTSYYCGPAAVHEALDALGVSLSQAAAAAALHTSTNGTGWSQAGTSPSGYPIPDVLNAHQSRNFYVPQAVSAPTSSAINIYEDDLETDVSGWGAPLIGDAWETSSSDYHLVGHPRDRTIFHWFEIRGYANSGASTLYEDSVHNAGSVSWHAGVPAYSTLPSSWIVSIVAGRGYVW